MLAAALMVPFAFLLIAAAVKDVLTMTIPNWIPLALLGSFALIAPFLLSPSDLGVHVAAGLGALVLGFTLFALNWLGGGDAKLLAAAALWLGVGAMLQFVVWTALAGGAMSLILLSARKTAFMLPIGLGDNALGRLLAPKAAIPYGVAIAVGGLLALPNSKLFLAASLLGS